MPAVALKLMGRNLLDFLCSFDVAGEAGKRVLFSYCSLKGISIGVRRYNIQLFFTRYVKVINILF